MAAVKHFNETHGHRKQGPNGSAEYRAWQSMIWRCHCSTNGAFHHYGARGVTVCDEWRGRGGFERFLAHIGPKPSARHSVDRIDNAGGYLPGNVRWATPIEQNANRTITRTLTLDGVTRTVSAWSRELGLEYATVMRRVALGKSAGECLAPPTVVSPMKGKHRRAA